MILGEKSSILSTVATTVLSLSGTAVMLFRVDPFEASLSAKVIFFIVLFLGSWGLLTLLSFFVWSFWSKQAGAEVIFRKSFWFSLLATTILLLLLLIRLKF